MTTRAKTARRENGVHSARPMPAPGDNGTGAPIESYENWDATREALVLEAYDPGTEYISTAPTNASRDGHPGKSAVTLDQDAAEVIAGIENRAQGR